jgi:DNA polymerase I-like protein with 3'-5' exonuclease and polymerase domains
MTQKGYIKTLGGRHSHVDPPVYDGGKKRTFEYKALNKLIQGSAADQTIECMIKAYEAGLPVLFPVHDEICMSCTEEEALKMKKIMESAVDLTIPVVVSMGKGGASWTEGDH